MKKFDGKNDFGMWKNKIWIDQRYKVYFWF